MHLLLCDQIIHLLFWLLGDRLSKIKGVNIDSWIFRLIVDVVLFDGLKENKSFCIEINNTI